MALGITRAQRGHHLGGERQRPLRLVGDAQHVEGSAVVRGGKRRHRRRIRQVTYCARPLGAWIVRAHGAARARACSTNPEVEERMR